MKTKYLKVLFTLSLLSMLSFQVLGITYYSADGTNISSTSNWWTNTNATGSNPSNFTTSGDIFIVQVGHSCSSSAGITFSNTTLTVNGTFTPVAAAVIAGNTLNGSGTISVTRTTSEGDNFKGQYAFSTRTLSSITIDYIGTSQQYFTYSLGTIIYKLKVSNDVRYTAENWTQLRYLEVVSGKIFDLQSYHIEVRSGMTNNGTITGSATDAIYTDNGNSAYSIEGNGMYPYVKLGNGTGPYTITGNNTFSTLRVSEGSLTLNCGTTTTLTNMSINASRIVSGAPTSGEWARVVNTNAVSNSGTVGSASTYLAFSGTISGGTVVNNGTNVLQSSSQAAACTPLPIKLLSFTAKKSGDSGLLNWTTVIETNNDYFSIERSLDAMYFETIANVEGAGNNFTKINYSYNDVHVPNGTLYYRLKQTDFDGNYTYSEVIVLQTDENNSAHMTMQQPFFDGSEIVTTICNITSSILNVEIIDLLCASLFAKTINPNDDTYVLTINAGILTRDKVYILRVYTNKEVIYNKFIF
jgi:hypothetical protein